MRRYFKVASLLWRRRTRQDRVALLGLDLPLDAGAAAANPNAEADTAHRLAAMPAIIRETYLLRAVDGMSIAEIADHLAISRREVRRNLRHAIAFLLA